MRHQRCRAECVDQADHIHLEDEGRELLAASHLEAEASSISELERIVDTSPEYDR